MRRRATYLVVAVVVATVVFALVAFWPAPALEFSYSFESDLEGWIPNGTDLVVDGDPMDWSVNRSQDLARSGASSVKLYLDNRHNQGKIWIERPFNTTPGRDVRVALRFALASSDFGHVNHWRIIACALPARPMSSADLESCYRGDTGNGLEEPGGYVWLEKAYETSVRMPAEGRLWVILGVWGTWEGPRTYYVDEVRVAVSG